MGKGPKVTPEIEVIIAEVFVENDDWPAKMVQVEVNRRLGGNGPKLSAIQKRLTKFRAEKSRKDAALDKDVAQGLGAPWKLVSDGDVPPEAVPAALQVWKWRFTLGLPLSVREAKWVARLHPVIADTLDLSNFVLSYAYREEACELSNQPFETADIDARLTMNSWEHTTARLVGKMTWIGHSTVGDLFSPTPLKDGVWTGTSVSKVATRELLDELIYENIDKQVPTENLKDELLLSDDLENRATEQGKWVYTHWLVYLSKGPRWSDLSVEGRMKLIGQLQEWILNHQWADKGYVGLVPGTDQKRARKDPQFSPLELLAQVGYDLAEWNRPPTLDERMAQKVREMRREEETQ